MIDDRNALVADPLFALVILWNQRADGFNKLCDIEETPEDRLLTDGQISAYRRTSYELMLVLDVILTT